MMQRTIRDKVAKLWENGIRKEASLGFSDDGK